MGEYFGPDWPSLEVRLKAGNYVTDTLLEFNKRFYDGRSIIEQYQAGTVALHFHGFGAGRFWCLTSRAPIGRNSNKPVTARTALRNKKMPVFVDVGMGLERLRPFATVERLEPLERCLMFSAQKVKPSARLFPRVGKMSIPARYRIFNKKFRSTIELSRRQVKALANEIIESPPQIVKCLADENRNNRWHFICGNDKIPSGIVFSPTYCYTGTGREFSYKVFDVFACPVYSREALIQGWLRAIGFRHDRRTQSDRCNTTYRSAFANAAEAALRDEA